MKNSYKLGIAFLAISLTIFSLIPSVFAQGWPTKSIEDIWKPWEVTFNQAIQSDSVTNDTIYIWDGSKKIATDSTIINGGKTIKIKPLVPYTFGQEYKLEIAGTIKSFGGKTINKPVSMPFNVVDKKGPIESISHVSSAGFINFIVKVRSDVYKVKINNIEMQMAGVDKYSQAFVDLKDGATVKVRAYSDTGKILETKDYIISK